MTALTRAEVERYQYDGFLFPFPALSEEQRAACLAGLERYERWLGMPVPKADLRWRTQPHALLPWYANLARHPRILDVVEDLIGPDILVWTGTFFIKEAVVADLRRLAPGFRPISAWSLTTRSRHGWH